LQYWNQIGLSLISETLYDILVRFSILSNITSLGQNQNVNW
jgi:hypothetical protein